MPAEHCDPGRQTNAAPSDATWVALAEMTGVTALLTTDVRTASAPARRRVALEVV